MPPFRHEHKPPKKPLSCRFPGSDFAWNAVNDVTDVDLLSEATIHLSTHKACENQAYNINNGDLFRWRDLWPKIAQHFGLETGPNLPLDLVSMMGTPDKKELWDKTVKVQEEEEDVYMLQPANKSDRMSHLHVQLHVSHCG